MSQTLRNLLIAGVLALVGIVLTVSYIDGEKRDLSLGKEEVTVLVAKKDIPAGTPSGTLESEGFLEKTDILREDLPPRPLSDIKDVKDLSSNQTIYKGETLSGHQFETKNSLNPADAIKGTERLASVSITPYGTVSELPRPGDRVDLMASGTVKAVTYNGKDFEEAVCTWVAARDVLIVQTPDSLEAQATGEEGAPEVAATSTKATDDEQLYVVQATDEGLQGIHYSYATSDDTKLVMNLRPSSADQETKLPPRCGLPTVN
jgi:pilus assembly protein CpaB